MGTSATRVQCITCGGIYAPTQADGSEYYHVCPPLNVAELKAAIAAGTLTMSPATKARYDAAVAADATTPPPAGAAGHVDQLLSTFVVSRPKGRNENIMRSPDRTQPPTIVSAGQGTRPAPDDPPTTAA